MRKILVTILILFLFAAPLVCGCGHEALADSSYQVAHTDADRDHSKNQAEQDCHKADMQLSAQVSVDAPNLKNSLNLYLATTYQDSVWTLPWLKTREIRGPPDADPPDPPLPVYLTTQRLRI